MKQHIYETELTNPMLAKKIKGIIGEMEVYIVADSAEPKSIAELRELDIYLIACKK